MNHSMHRRTTDIKNYSRRIALFFAALSLCFVCSRMMACLGCAPDFPEEHSLPPLPEFGESFDAQPIPDMPDELRDYLEGGVSG